MKKITALLLAVCMLVLSGCGASASVETTAAGTSAAETAAQENKELRKISVVLDWYPNAIHEFLYNAIEKGYFAEEGLEVTLQFPSNTNDAMSLVAAGKAEIGMYYLHQVVRAVVDQNIPVKSFGSIILHPLNVILSLKDKNITGAADLVGRTIGYGGDELSEKYISTIMQAVGADSSSVKMVDVGFELMSAMTTGNVDATIGCMLNHEVPQLEEEGFEVNYFTMEEYGVPDCYEEIFITNDKVLQEEPEIIQAFMRACKKGFADMKNDPDGSLKILMDNQNEANFPLTESVEKQSNQVLIPLMEEEGAPFMSQSEKVWQENIDWMYDNGMISRKPDLSEVMVNINYE